MMVNKFITFAALFAFAQAEAEANIASTCIQERTHLYGIHKEDDAFFTDYNYLSNTEEFNSIYRMTRLQLCENAEGDFVGMRSHVTRYNADTMTATSRLSMNKIGTVVGTGISCSGMILDAENGEYITGIYFAYEEPGQIDYIRAQTNKNQQISKGSLTSSMTTSDMTAIHDTRVLAFHGYENSRVSAVG